MSIYTSYFYQVRFFDSKTYGFSTAKWDPKWFHDFKGEDHVFLHEPDGVVYGMKCYALIPGPTCDNKCRGRDNCSTGDPGTCEFLKCYREQLNELDINQVIKELEEISEGGDICLLFHEDPSNPCSERWVVKQWFKDNGKEIKEWNGWDSGLV